MGMSFLPPDYKTPETCPSYDHKPKVLELIAQTLGSGFSKSATMLLLKSAGVPGSEIKNKNENWKIILDAFKYAMNENNKAQINIERVIEEFLDPLSHNADEEKAKILSGKIEKLLKYDKLILRQVDERQR